MDTERLQERIVYYLKAFVQLGKAIQQPKNEFLRDSVIQRFEFTYELAWKLLKIRLEAESVIARTPREVLQEALQAGFIEDGNAWSELQKTRNLTSHTYDEALAEQVYNYIVNKGCCLFTELAKQAELWKTSA